MIHPLIVWFKHDLRIADHPALHAAAETGRPLIAVYIFDEEVPGEWQLGAASKWWLQQSLKSLSRDLEKLGGRLILRRGQYKQVLQSLLSEVRASAIFWNRGYEPYMRSQEEQLSKSLEEQNIQVNTFNGNLLIEPWEISNKQGKYFKVFTHYWNSCLKILEPPHPLPKPPKIDFYKGAVHSDELSDWGLAEENGHRFKEFRNYWQPGETAATNRCHEFLKNALGDYDIKRDFPAEIGTSQLSPHLHFGEISPKMIWQALEDSKNSSSRAASSKGRYLAELGWREFSYYLLYHFPKLPKEPFNERFSNFPWRKNAELLQAWQSGLTGYPVVDAGMRQLWHTGWMHNRVRMIVASFLTKDLLIPWQKGAEWFWQTLVDADLANNSASWQWVAGCGADAAPYFRIFNPALQSKKFDAAGDYIKRWVPELKNLPSKYLHAPWEVSSSLLSDYGVVLGKTYPFPIVDHAKARLEALAAFNTCK